MTTPPPIRTPYLIFLGDVSDPIMAKTGSGVAYWRPEICRGELTLPGGSISLGLPQMGLKEAREAGVGTLVIGVANSGGFLPQHWQETLADALEAGLDLASGLHARLSEIPEIAELAARLGRTIHDVRHPSRAFPVGTGRARSGKRLLTVGTDCAVGKMYASLAIERELRARGVAADFRATGQTGIFIAGEGVSVDAVVSDFVSGATELLSPDAADDHWDIVEGQGSLFHPAYAGVTLGLIHGSQPDALIICHEAGRAHLHEYEDFATPPLALAIARNVEAARLTNPDCRCVGISVNTSRLSEPEALSYLKETSEVLGLPCVDPVRTGVAALVDHLLEQSNAEPLVASR